MNSNSGLNEIVVLTSDEPWSDIWHTQLHYAYQVSKRCKVFYLNPPGPWKISNLFDFKPESKQISENLKVVRYKNLLPSFIGILSVFINDFINEILIKKQIPGFNSKSKLVVWHFDPFRSLYIFRKFSNAKHVYHVVDPVVGYHLDKEMALMADLVIVTSPKFLSHYQSLNKNVMQVGQGVDLDFFNEKFTPDSLKSLVSYDSILLLGTFSDEIDYRFLHLLAARYPGKLVLIGPDKTVADDTKATLEKLKSIPGVQWLGPMNPVVFHKHLVACRVGIITYTYSNYERNNLRSPLKVISYLACGKCIISNIDCEMPDLTNKAIYIVDNDNAYFELLDASYKNELQFDESAVGEFLSAMDYQKLLTTIFAGMGEQLPSLKLKTSWSQN